MITDQETQIDSFKKGETDLIFSTKTYRGIDLPDDTCRSIIILKYPFPDLSDPQFIMMKKKLRDEAFWPYYRDLATRALYQQVGRGLRTENDWIEVWSPDSNVHDELAP